MRHQHFGPKCSLTSSSGNRTSKLTICLLHCSQHKPVRHVFWLQQLKAPKMEPEVMVSVALLLTLAPTNMCLVKAVGWKKHRATLPACFLVTVCRIWNMQLLKLDITYGVLGYIHVIWSHTFNCLGKNKEQNVHRAQLGFIFSHHNSFKKICRNVIK